MKYGKNTVFLRPGVKAFILNEHNQILVVKERVKRQDKIKIIYDLPGGGIEVGEGLDEALHREVFEEVGLKIQIERPVGGWDFVVNSITNPDKQVHIICLGYQCRIIGSNAIDTSQNPAQEDIFETIWLSKEQILSDETIFINPQMRQSLENIQT